MGHALQSYFLSKLPHHWSLYHLLVRVLPIKRRQLLESILPVCMVSSDIALLGQLSDETQVDEEAEDNIQSESLPIPKITSYKEAIIALEDVQTFLEAMGICPLQLHILGLQSMPLHH